MELKKVLRGIYALFERAILEGTRFSRRKRWFLYLILTTGALAAIWLPVIAFIKTTPQTYTAKWTLILPGAGVGSSINLESIGQAASAVSSPYTSPSLDPKVSYKQIATSDVVLGAAAEKVGMTIRAFGKPRIKLVDQTTLMYFSIGGLQPEKTYAKATALIEALTNQLEELRQSEIDRRAEAAQLYIQNFQAKLAHIERQLLDYQKASNLITQEQFQELATTVEKVRQERAIHLAQYKKVEGQAAHLAGMLSVSPEMAAELLTLQSNPIFGDYVTKYAEAQGKLTEYLGRWAHNHPEVVKARQHAIQARAALLSKAESLIGFSPRRKPELMERLLSEKHTQRHQLFQELIVAEVERHGVLAQVKSLEDSTAQLQNRLTQTIDAAATLSNLQLQHRVAAAVLTTSLAQLDIGKVDPFASYPLIQILEAPKIPSQPDTSKRMFALIGGTVGSISVIIGLAISWKRQDLFQRILKNA